MRKSKVAYAMASAPKPPREVRRQQAKYGTGSGSMESTARAAAMQKREQALRPYVAARSGSSTSRDDRSAGGKFKYYCIYSNSIALYSALRGQFLYRLSALLVLLWLSFITTVVECITTCKMFM